MREIKFRCWYAGYMYNHTEIDCINFAYNKIEMGNTYSSLRDEDLVLMQFTGKYDCEGKPIYEGDIIEFDRDEWGGDDNIHTVEWDEDNAEWSWGGGCTGDMEWRTVIGNIYENSELIEK